MKYTLIKGTFHVVGFSPDGDSMMFKAANPAHWSKLGDENRDVFAAKLAASENGAVQLRLQGIDALETHYSPEPLMTPADVKGRETSLQVKPAPGGYHQPAAIGQLATQKFMNLMGVKQAEWRSWGKNTWITRASIERDGKDVWITEKFQDALLGYIVTTEVEKNGRPLSWVFPGTCADEDGCELSKTALAERLEQSVNYCLLKEGLVYPYFFMTLAGCLRNVLISGVKLAQASAKRKLTSVAKTPLPTGQKVPNLWFYDQTGTGMQINDLKQITEDQELCPYLFRKTVKAWYSQQMALYWDAIRTNKPYTCDAVKRPVLIEKLFADGDPYVFVVSEQDFVKFSEIVELKGDRLKLLYSPMDLVFLS